MEDNNESQNMDQQPNQQPNGQQQEQPTSVYVSNAPAEDAPMGSDYDAENDDDFVYAEDDEMAQLEAQADEDEALAMAEGQGPVNDFETYQEDEFAEGDEYADGEVLQLTAERNDSVAQFNDHKDSVYCVDTIPVAPFNFIVSGDGADKAYVWHLTPKEEPEEQEV